MPITITILGITVGVSAVMLKAVGKTVESKFRSWKQQRAEKKRFENINRVASKNQVSTSILSPCHLAVLGDVEAGKTTLIFRRYSIYILKAFFFCSLLFPRSEFAFYGLSYCF